MHAYRSRRKKNKMEKKSEQINVAESGDSDDIVTIEPTSRCKCSVCTLRSTVCIAIDCDSVISCKRSQTSLSSSNASSNEWIPFRFRIYCCHCTFQVPLTPRIGSRSLSRANTLTILVSLSQSYRNRICCAQNEMEREREGNMWAMFDALTAVVIYYFIHSWRALKRFRGKILSLSNCVHISLKFNKFRIKNTSQETMAKCGRKKIVKFGISQSLSVFTKHLPFSSRNHSEKPVVYRPSRSNRVIPHQPMTKVLSSTSSSISVKSVKHLRGHGDSLPFWQRLVDDNWIVA